MTITLKTLRSAASSMLFVGLIAGVGLLDVGSAAPVLTTVNAANTASTMSVPPPLDVEVTLTLQAVPTACTASIAWVAPAGSVATGYEIRRTGPFPADLGVVTTTTYVDANVPLGVLGNVHQWEVRTMLGNWTSAWVVATPTAIVPIPLLCLPG